MSQPTLPRKALAAVPDIAMLRLGVAAVQALALLLLTEAARTPYTWLATDPVAFVPLLLVLVFVPVLAMLGLGVLRLRPLGGWLAAASLVLAVLGACEGARGSVAGFGFPVVVTSALWPRLAFWLAVSGAMFVAHVLVVDSIIERRFMPSYRRHFDTAWKLGLQAALSVLFVGVFWGILELGAGLFRLVALGGFSRLLTHDWCFLPATTVALAVSIHATDVQPALIRSTRGLVLTLFSWLLPLLAGILLAFLATLPLISLRPLWNTHFAAGLLLTAAGLLIFLINTCYQDGTADAAAGPFKRLAASIGAFELAPLVGLAMWALELRVLQYGWTAERVTAAAAVMAFGCYAVGYAAAVVASSSWLKRVEITNFATAYVCLALVLLLFTPIADPSRLMVASQLAALRSGAVPVERFDFRALKFDGARWGTAALRELAERQDPGSELIAAQAKAALAATSRFGVSPPRLEQIAAGITVFPTGRRLPPDFQGAGSDGNVQNLLRMCKRQDCVARYMNLQPGTTESLILVSRFAGYVFDPDAQGVWHQTATLIGNFTCKRLREERAGGAFMLLPHAEPDVVIGGERLTVTPSHVTCNNAAAR